MRSRLDRRENTKNLKSVFVSNKNPLIEELHSQHGQNNAGMGLLVLVTSATMSGTDLVLSAARRRYLSDPSLEFPTRISTKNSEQDLEHISVARRVFHEIAARKGFVVAWKHEDVSYGLTAGSFEALETGRIVVLAVPPEAVAHFKNVWSRVEVIPIGSDVDQARPQTRVWMSYTFPACPSAFISHSSDLAQALRNFIERLDILRKEHQAKSP